MFEFVEIECIEELDETSDVFDITVDDTHCFFAEGMLVHNCIGGPFAYDIMHELRNVQGPALDASALDDPTRMDAVLARIGNTHDQLCDAVGPEHVFLELQFNSLPQQHLVNRALLEYAKRRGMTQQLTAAADSHYCRPEFWAEREIYKMLGRLNYDQIDASLLPTSKEQLKCELYPKNAEQMWASYIDGAANWSFYDDVLVKSAIERTWDIAHGLVGNVEPDVSIKLPTSIVTPGMTSMQMLIELCKDGMMRMGLHVKPKYIERLRYELSVLRQIAKEKGKDFSLYFVTQRVITEIAEKSQLIGCGRGSAAGSLINYVLGITAVDPLKYGLIFERFLNPARAEMPDIDSDFEDCDRLVQDLRAKFGVDNVLPITNYNTLQLKSLLKDLGRLYGASFDEINDLTGRIEAEVKPHVIDAGENKSLFQLKHDDCMQHSARYRAFMEAHPDIERNVRVLYKQNKSLGCHASGVIIAEGIDSKMPVIVTRNGPQAPWVEGLHYKHLGDYGFVKFDLLGLDTLRIIRRTIELILSRQAVIPETGHSLPGGATNPATWPKVKAWYDAHLHPDVIDFNDQRVYENVYHAGKWAGIFQFTSPGAQRFIKKFVPRNIDDIAVATAIYRPGPLAGHYDEIYLKAKADPSAVVYDHPAIKEVLGYTYGTLVFQEQLMALANKLAGMSLPDCDRLRKAIVKRSVSGNAKNKGEIVLLEEMFIEGAVRNGLVREKAYALFENMAAFAGYAFNASHSYSYAIDSFMCAYLETYHEAEWLCSYLESQMGNADSRGAAIAAVKSFGYSIGKVDINMSTDRWVIGPDGRTFVPPLLSVKGVGQSAVDEIVANRPYKSVEDLLWDADGKWKHSKFNKRAMENLICVGAFGSMNIVSSNSTQLQCCQGCEIQDHKRIAGEHCQGCEVQDHDLSDSSMRHGKIKFANWHQMHAILIDNQDQLKKKYGQELLPRLVASLDVEEWSNPERAAFHRELVGDLNVDFVLDPIAQARLAARNVLSIDDMQSGDKTIAWFVVTGQKHLTTKKNNKSYVMLHAAGSSGTSHRINVWGANTNVNLELNAAYIAELEKNEWGLSTRITSIRKM